ncbi:hypothetical protein GCM10007067_06960 [Lysobacter bugurensis]|uniref:O-antigen ligase domain-containing protein n=2 Tax=Cognatilysobacter bugurensis TaxID=543356 RepID=A0A918W697_9GAMM|nr:hypothetical protein GCM10007067_06960 [Lysobacter bugurensis]
MALFFLMSPFEDLPFQTGPLGYAAANLAIIPLIALALTSICRNRLPLEFVVLLSWGVAASLIGFFLYYELATKTLVVQALKAFILYFMCVFAFFYFRFARNVPQFALLAGAGIVVAAVIANTLWPDAFSSSSWMHPFDNRNARPRGLSQESSNFGLIAGCAVLLICWKKKVRPGISIALVAVVALAIESKGTIFAIFGATIFTVLLSRGVGSAKRFILVFVALAGASILLPLASALLLSDIENYTSVATRATMSTVAALSVAQWPLGHGFYGYLPFVVQAGPEAVLLMRELLPMTLDYSEVNSYFYHGAYENVGAKSFLLDTTIFLGLPGIYLILKQGLSGFAYVSTAADMNRMLLAGFAVIGFMFYVSGVGAYFAAASLGLAFNRYEQ